MILLIAFSALVATRVPADDGFVREYEWRTGNAVAAHGIYVLRKSAAVHVSTLLYSSETGSRFVLSSHSDARTGVFTTRLTDDETGWWIEVSTRYGVRADTMAALVKLVDPETGKPPAQIAMFVTVCGGQRTRDVRVPFSDPAEKQWLTLASSAGEWKHAIAPVVAERLRKELPLLQRALGDVYSGLTYGFRAPVDVAMAALEIPISPRIVVAHEQRGGRGFLLTTADQLTLASRFKSIPEPSEPLPSLSPN